MDENELADLSYEYFNKAFLREKGRGADKSHTYYGVTLSLKTDWFFLWEEAQCVLMVEDRHDFRGDTNVKSLISDLLEAFVVHESYTGPWENARQNKDFSKIAKEKGLSDWTGIDYNYELLWAGLIFIRAYLITGNEFYLEQAKWDFDLIYTRGWTDELGGGIWLTVEKTDKSGVSNNPAVVMACYLYEATKDEKYLDYAKRIYQWVKDVLYKDEDGSVRDQINADGTFISDFNIYTQGTFIEGASLLYKYTSDEKYKNDLLKTFEFVMVNKVTDEGIMSEWKTDGILQSELARGIATFLKHNPSYWSYEGHYTRERKPITIYDWMRLNADAAWDIYIAEQVIQKIPQDLVGRVVQINVTPQNRPY